MPGIIITLWRKAPASRILIAMIAGIILEWKIKLGPSAWAIVLGVSFILAFLNFFIPLFHRFRAQYFTGVFLSLLFIAAGGIRTWFADIRNNNYWYGNKSPGLLIIKTTGEPVEKPRTFKIIAEVLAICTVTRQHKATGRIIIYIKKGSEPPPVPPGSELIINKSPRGISNENITGGFDYKQYCLFKGITHQVYLEKKDYLLIRNYPGWSEKSLHQIRSYILGLLRKSFTSEKEKGLAEALLIGYRQDLDPELVKAYTSTGVVHIIAISGLHIGLVYWILTLLFSPFNKNRNLLWLKAVFIISGLWLFSLLAGAQPSILRSALMFTCICIGANISRKSSVYNALALSAIVLLVHDPFWLWDLGFQLSYAAVLSIIIYQRPVYHLLYFRNKLLDLFWKMNAVTLSAQILTVPVCIYYFNQFPNYFLLTNIIAVPLSSLILLGEIILCLFGELEPLRELCGQILGWMIRLMNNCIETIANLPYAVSSGLHLSFAQLVVFYAMLAYLYAHAKKD